jgi:hypothetical protein
MHGFRDRRTAFAVLAAVLAPVASATGARPLDADPAPPAQVAGPASPPATVTPGGAVHGYRIEDWKVLSNESLVIRTNDGKRYRATLMGRCIGLKFTDTIAFVTRGERTVDRYAGIMLPDGSRCYFKTFEAVSQPTDSREAPLKAPTGRRPPAAPSR